jgi:hypothetical protein
MDGISKEQVPVEIPAAEVKIPKELMKTSTELIPKLAIEAEALIPLIDWCSCEYKEGRLTDYDFVGIFVLAYLALRRPNTWLGGKLKEPISNSDRRDKGYLSVAIVNGPPLLGQLLNLDYLKRKFGASVNTLSVVDVFNRMQFVGIRNKDNYINACIVNWALEKRPCVLLFRIPR